jgi:hypothetical protein
VEIEVEPRSELLCFPGTERLPAGPRGIYCKKKNCRESPLPQSPHASILASIAIHSNLLRPSSFPDKFDDDDEFYISLV